MANNKKSIKFEADTSNFTKNIKDAQNTIKSLNNELKLNQTQLKGTTDNTNLLNTRLGTLKEKYEEQSRIVDNTNQKYQKAVEIYGENSKEAQNLKNQLDKHVIVQQQISNEINETNKKIIEQSENFTKAGDKIANAGEKISSFGGKVEGIGNKLSVISAGVATVAGASLKASIDFESSFAGVRKTVDATEEELAELRTTIIEMSKELPSSANEIANVAESAGQLGIETENIATFSRAMIDLGNSTNMSATDASTALARFANITQMSQKDFDKLGSTIVDLRKQIRNNRK